MAVDSASATKISLGIVASRIGAEDLLRYCPVCADEDRESIGIATWYRPHQLPGVLICPYHGAPLLQSDCLAQRLGRQRLFLPESADIQFRWSRLHTRAPTTAKLLFVARLSAEIFMLNRPHVGTLSLRANYAEHLLARGLAASLSRVRQRELRNAFLDFWSPLKNVHPFETLLESIRQNGEWLAKLCRKQRCANHPLKHLLLIGFLEKNMSSFFHAHPKPAAISRHNPSAQRTAALDHKFTILVNDGSMSLRKIANTLNMSTNTALVKAEKMGRPINRRPKSVDAALRAKIRLSLASGDAIRDITSSLHVSNSTINRVLGGDRILQRQRLATLHASRRISARNNLLAAIRRSPHAGFNVLQAGMPADFKWLYRHDRDWLKFHLPISPRTLAVKPAVDWRIRDNWMANQVRNVVAEILSVPGKPVRVTLNEIGRRTGHASWLDKQRSKLPETRDLLSQVLESLENFQARRVNWWDEYFASLDSFEEVSHWRVIRAAGMRD